MSADTAERFCSTQSDSSQALSAGPTGVVSMGGREGELAVGEGVVGGHIKVENGEERVETEGFPEGWWT